MRINRRKLGTSYTRLCQCKLFPLLQSIVEVPGSESEILHPKFTINQKPRNRLSSIGTNAFSQHLHVEMLKWDFKRARTCPDFREKKRWLQVVGQSGRAQRKNR